MIVELHPGWERAADASETGTQPAVRELPPARPRTALDTERDADPAWRIRVLVVDDHDFVRSQLVTLLDTCDDMEVVGQCSAGEQVLDTATRVLPDVVLMDVQMGAMSGLAATRGLLAVRPAARVLVLTASPSVTVEQNAAASGACGFLIKGGVDRRWSCR